MTEGSYRTSGSRSLVEDDDDGFPSSSWEWIPVLETVGQCCLPVILSIGIHPQLVFVSSHLRNREIDS